MDFTIEEYNEEINLTIIEDGDTLEFSIEEVVEEVNITIEEYNGADGLKGDKGDKGDTGLQGVQGIQGEQGVQGEQGIQGIKGDKGDKGEDGLSGIQSVVAGDNITIDNTDPLNPIISAEDGGTTVTKTSDLTNDGEDGANPFITLDDIPDVTVPTNTSDLNNDGADGVHPFITAEDIVIPPPLPSGGVAGNVLEFDAVDGAKWSGRLTDAENEIDAEIVNRALADALKLDKPLAPNNVNTKVILGDGSTKNISDFSQVEQIEVGASGNAQESWKGKLVLLTASCTITIPTGLSNNWSCEIATMDGVTLTWAITSPKTWLFGTPPTLPEKSMCTVSQRGNTNDIMLFGGYGI